VPIKNRFARVRDFSTQDFNRLSLLLSMRAETHTLWPGSATHTTDMTWRYVGCVTRA
jgi:hypothetical protein